MDVIALAAAPASVPVASVPAWSGGSGPEGMSRFPAVDADPDEPDNTSTYVQSTRTTSVALLAQITVTELVGVEDPAPAIVTSKV
jgi:hypothetical protein